MLELELFQMYHLKEMSLSAELFLSCSIFQLTFYAIGTAYQRKHKFVVLNQQIYYLSILIVSLATLLIINEDLFSLNFYSSNNSIINDYLSFISKLIICITAILFFFIVKTFVKDEPLQNNFEYVVLIIISILGLLLLCSSNDLITAYLSIELQSVAFYIMAAFKKNSSYSIESGLKYFIIGSLSSAFFLFGSSLIYGCIGSLNFDDFKMFFPFLFLFNIKESINFVDFLQKNYFDLDLNKLFSNLFLSIFINEFNQNFEWGIHFFIDESVKNFDWATPYSILIRNINFFNPPFEGLTYYFLDTYYFLETYSIRNTVASVSVHKALSIDEVLTASLFSVSDSLVDWIVEKNSENILFDSTFLYYDNTVKITSGFFFIKTILYMTFFNNHIDYTYANFMICIYYNLYSNYSILDYLPSSLNISLIYSLFFCEGFSQYCSGNNSYFSKIFPNSDWTKLNLDNLNVHFKNFDIRQKFSDFEFLNSNENFLLIINILKYFTEILHDGSLYLNYNSNQFYIIVLASIGFIFIFISLFIKLAIAPFHFWSLDVYEGSPNTTTFFFVVLPKIAILILLLRICYSSFYSIFSLNKFYFFIFAVLSIFVGSFGGLEQRKLKSLLAYSSISHTGYLLLSFSTNTLEGIQMMLYYIVIYMIAGLCFWSIYLFLKQKQNFYLNKHNKELGDLILLKKTNPMIGIVLAITFFSIAGIPPIVGFLAKVGIFLVVIKSSAYLISLISILLSVASTFYYIRFVKVLYFENILVGKLYLPITTKKSLIISILSLSLILLCIDPMIIYLLFHKAVLLYNY